MIRQVSTLLAGNALSQIVNLATILFVVTAFFTPEEFGYYAVLMSYVGILSSVACLRYELAIISVRRRYAANNIILACLIIAVVFSAFTWVVIKLVAEIVSERFLLGESAQIIAFLVFLKAIDQIIASILYRQEAYFRYSMLKLLQALMLLGGFVVSGITGRGQSGMLLATMIAYASFAVSGVVVIHRYDLQAGLRAVRVTALIRKQADFVKFSMPQTLIDNILSNGLNFVLIALAGPAVVGYFNYMQKVLKAPLGLVFGAISQVVFRFSAKNQTDAALVTRMLQQVFPLVGGILMIAAAGIGFTYVFFSDLAFLQSWNGLQEYMIGFSVWMLVPFLFSPFATLPIVYGLQKKFFIAATTFNVLSLAAFALLIWKGPLIGAFWAMGLASIPYYAGLNLWLFRVVNSEQ